MANPGQETQTTSSGVTVSNQAEKYPAGSTVRTYTFGKKTYQVPDRFAELESNTPKVMAWVETQNAKARENLLALPEYQIFLKSLTAFNPTNTIDAPISAGDYLFSKERRNGEEQPSLLVTSKSTGETNKLVDPSKLAGKTSVDAFFPSPDGKMIIVATSQGGNEASVLSVLDTATGKEVSRKIPRANWPTVAWSPDSSGFYYNQYPEPGTVKKGEENYHRRIFQTKLGSTSQVEVEIPGRQLKDFPFVHSDEESSWIAFGSSKGAGENTLRIRSTASGEEFEVSKENVERGKYEPIFTPRGLGVTTTVGAAKGKYVEYTLPKDGELTTLPPSKLVIPEHKSMILKEVLSSGGLLVAHYLDNLKSKLVVFDSDGNQLRELPLPGVGTISKITSDRKSEEIYVQYSSFTSPGQVQKINVTTGKSEDFSKVEVPFDPNKFEVTQILAKSKDGTSIPAFVVQKKGAARDSQNPTLLTGYGGFNRNMLPGYSAFYASWVDRGGTLVVANLRGGGEFGEAWHQAGMLEKKQNVFDDYIAVAKELVKQRITSPGKLAAYGGSNGGLLVTAVMNQKPELFGAAVAAVPLTDMLRYDLSKIAQYWITEYGTANGKSEEQFKYLKKYSPYHNISKSKSYPPMIVTNGENDPRVDPMHARKYFAELINTARLRGPAYLLTNFNSGHGVNESRSIQISQSAQSLAFLWTMLHRDRSSK